MTRSLAVLALLASASAAAAATPAIPGNAAPFASSYWSGFVDFWTKWLQNRNSVLFTILIVGAIAVFIITRGKKLK